MSATKELLAALLAPPDARPVDFNNGLSDAAAISKVVDCTAACFNRAVIVDDDKAADGHGVVQVLEGIHR